MSGALAFLVDQCHGVGRRAGQRLLDLVDRLLERLALGVVDGVRPRPPRRRPPRSPAATSEDPDQALLFGGRSVLAGIAITARSSAVSMACFCSASALR